MEPNTSHLQDGSGPGRPAPALSEGSRYLASVLADDHSAIVLVADHRKQADPAPERAQRLDEPWPPERPAPRSATASRRSARPESWLSTRH